MRRATIFATAIAAALAGPAAFAAPGPDNARIAGRVLVCNAPRHCLTRTFKVSAINSSGHTVARTTTYGRKNDYALAVAPGSYRLVAKSSGLVCRASAVATAHQTTRQNITCLVP